jgi:GDP-D-mannose dehydratase
MWRMLQQDAPEDFVLATGEMHYVREFVEKAFCVVGVEIQSVGPKLWSFFLLTVVVSHLDGLVKMWMK